MRISEYECGIKLLGTKHSGSENRTIHEKIEEYEPDLVCIESKLGTGLSKKNNELFVAEQVANQIGAETWYIDLLEDDYSEFRRIASETMTPLEIETIFNSEKSVEKQRERVRECSRELYIHNLCRESTMLACIQHATKCFDNICVVVGTAHYLQLRYLLDAI